MTTYVTLTIEDDYAAWALIFDLYEYPDSPLLTPGVENTVMATLASVISNPEPPNIPDPPCNERNRHA